MSSIHCLGRAYVNPSYSAGRPLPSRSLCNEVYSTFSLKKNVKRDNTTFFMPDELSKINSRRLTSSSERYALNTLCCKDVSLQNEHAMFVLIVYDGMLYNTSILPHSLRSHFFSLRPFSHPYMFTRRGTQTHTFMHIYIETYVPTYIP